MHVDLGGGPLPGPVGADEGTHGVDVVRPVRAVIGEQLAEHLIDE